MAAVRVAVVLLSPEVRQMVLWLNSGIMLIFGGTGLALSVAYPGPSDPGSVLAAVFFFGCGACGLTRQVYLRRVDTRRREPVLGPAPSGAPATCFLRSPLVAAVTGVITLFVAGWLGAVAVVVYGHGYYYEALLLTGALLFLVWRLALLATRRTVLGGLWLTRSGVEYRRNATGWRVSWEQLERVLSVAEAEHAPPRPVRRPGEPVFLVLPADERAEGVRQGRWGRDHRYRFPDNVLVVDTAGLSGDRALIVETLERHLSFPPMRATLGTAASLPGATV